MTITEIRKRFIEFYEARGHVHIPSAPLVPQNDPTTLFTGSGMQPLVPYLLGEPHPKGNRLVDSQKSFRAADIEEVGDNRHTTFFEMLGNWSLGDYFKREQLRWFFTFLVDEIGLDPARIYVTVFAGDESLGIPRDDESVAIWQELFRERGIEATAIHIGSEENGYEVGMQGGRIFYYDTAKNWWSRSGKPENMPTGEIGGPDSEVFYDFGPEHATHPEYKNKKPHPNSDSGQFLEIGNSVFMQYIKRSDGTFAELPKLNVDFGGGLERIAAAKAGDSDVFRIDALWEIIELLQHYSGKNYADSRYQRSFRIVADHMRAATFMLGDGVRPSNTERGYVLRRLLRRASYHAQRIGIAAEKSEDSMLVRSAIIVIEKYKQHYVELSGEQVFQDITSEIWKEEIQFAITLQNGLKQFDNYFSSWVRGADQNALEAQESATKDLPPSIVYELITTYGLPKEMVVEEAASRDLFIDWPKVEARLEDHRRISRAGSEQKFKGGLADASEKTTRLHTAHHLLLKALQTVLGPHVKQRGSNITQERLRIDFSHGEKMTKEQLADVERIVNERIAAAMPVIRSTLPKEEAEMLGAEHEFGAKYPDMVSVYSIGPITATQENPDFMNAYSIEFCGGPHVSNTKELSQSGVFKILKEEAVAAGVRRIKAVLA